jgi:hypothetical protein
MATVEASGLASGTAAAVGELVESSFGQAQQYASDVRREAVTALATLNNTVMHPVLNEDVDVTFDYTGDEIATNFQEDKPIKPEIDFNFDFIKPILGNIKEIPEFSYLTSSIDTARADFISRILDVLREGATGLDPVVEQQIWDRARSRQEIENARQYTEAETYFSSRGFTLPPGALAGRLQEIAIEIARNDSYLNTDITTKQAELAQSNFQFVLEKGSAIVLDMMKTSISSVIEYNKGTIEVFSAELEIYKQEIQTKLATIEGIIKVFVAEADAYKSVASVDNMNITAQIEINKMKLQEATVQAEIDIKEVTLELDAATKVFTLQVEAMKANATILSQIAASALSGINASASYGFSGGANLSESDGYSHTWDHTKSNETFSTIRNLTA